MVELIRKQEVYAIVGAAMQVYDELEWGEIAHCSPKKQRPRSPRGLAKIREIRGKDRVEVSDWPG